MKQSLKDKFIENKIKVSKAMEVRSLLQKQKTLWKKKQSLTDFQEPILFFIRRDGTMEVHEKATAGKFLFSHSNGQERYIELRPSDQLSMPYGDRRVRTYVAHEDRPFSGFDNVIMDGETVMNGYTKIKSSDLKYEATLIGLKNKSKMTILWVVGGIILAIALALTVIPSDVWGKIFGAGG